MTAKVYRMDGVPEWISKIAERAEMSIASLDGKIFATDGHVCVVAFDAPEGLAPLTEMTRPKLGEVVGILKEPEASTSYTIPLLDLKSWCGPLGPTISCSTCDDEGAIECDGCKGSGVLSMKCGLAGCRGNHEDTCCVCLGDAYTDCENCGADFKQWRFGNVQGVRVNMALVWAVVGHLEGDTVRVVVGGPEKSLRFYGGGWTVVVMAMRSKPEEVAEAKELKLQ